MTQYNEILKKIAAIPDSFGALILSMKILAALNTSNLRQKFSPVIIWSSVLDVHMEAPEPISVLRWQTSWRSITMMQKFWSGFEKNGAEEEDIEIIAIM